MIAAPADRGVQDKPFHHTSNSETIDDLDSATRYFNRTIAAGRGIITRSISNERGAYANVVEFPKMTAFNFPVYEKYFVLYKRSWFHQFGRVYDKREQTGTTATPSMLKMAVLEDAMIGIIFIDRTIYEIKGQVFWNYCQDNNTVRDAMWNGVPYPEASCPKSLLRRVL